MKIFIWINRDWARSASKFLTQNSELGWKIYKNLTKSAFGISPSHLVDKLVSTMQRLRLKGYDGFFRFRFQFQSLSWKFLNDVERLGYKRNFFNWLLQTSTRLYLKFGEIKKDKKSSSLQLWWKAPLWRSKRLECSNHMFDSNIRQVECSISVVASQPLSSTAMSEVN